MIPQRLQRKRTKGWRMPAGARCVTRPGVFGNPFTVKGARDAGYGTHNPDGSRASDAESNARLAAWCVDLFRRWVATGKEWDGPVADKARAKLLARLPELRGKDLYCFCPVTKPDGTPHPCHADFLIELANAPETT